MLVTRARTERPHGALLQLDTGTSVLHVQDRWEATKGYGRQSVLEPTVGIPPLEYWVSNHAAVNPAGGTMSGGEFDWGGRLRKGIGGAQRFPQNGWKPFEECKGRRELD